MRSRPPAPGSLPAPVAVAAALALAGCQSTGPGNLAVASSRAAVPTMEHIMKTATACWYGSRDTAFGSYRLAPELNAIAGPPRLLLVPAGNPQARPLAVIQAEGSPARVEAYGPLMGKPVGARISADVRRWAAGGTGCGASA